MQPLDGYQLEREGSHAVALDLHLDDELRRRGLAREVIHAVQNARKGAGLAVEDRIALTLGGDAELRALQENIAGNGSVRNSARIEQPRLLDAFVFTPGTLVESVREGLRTRILAVLSNADPAARGVVVAVEVGDQAAIPSRRWTHMTTMTRTGGARWRPTASSLPCESAPMKRSVPRVSPAMAGRRWPTSMTKTSPRALPRTATSF